MMGRAASLSEPTTNFSTVGRPASIAVRVRRWQVRTFTMPSTSFDAKNWCDPHRCVY